MQPESDLRADIISICRRLERSGLIAAMDGNISQRLAEDRLLITPSGKAKGRLTPRDLIVVDLNGKVLEGCGKPSSEIRMHLLVYEKRPDVNSIVHAHPPMLTAFTLSGIPFVSEALPEVWLTLGPVPTAPYATPTTQEVPEAIAPFLESHRAILMERHGALTFGGTLEEAYMRLEKLEHAAHILFYARLLKEDCPLPLSPEALARLKALT